MAEQLSEYDPEWPRWFEAVRDALPSGLRVEHVGSTSIPGLVAKPVIDVDVVVASAAEVAGCIRDLGAAGWRHEGDLGIPGREAFSPRPGLPPHHLYLVIDGNPPHRDHVDLRDRLRKDAEDAARYAATKRGLAPLLEHDRAAYTEGKTAIIAEILSRARGSVND